MHRPLMILALLLGLLLTPAMSVMAMNGTPTPDLCTESADCICPDDERVCYPATPEPTGPTAVEPLLDYNGEDVYVFELPSTGAGSTADQLRQSFIAPPYWRTWGNPYYINGNWWVIQCLYSPTYGWMCSSMRWVMLA